MPDASEATSTRQVSKRETQGHSVSPSLTLPTFMVQGRIPQTTSERRPSTYGTTSQAISGRGNCCQPTLSFPFLVPYSGIKGSYLFLTLPCRAFAFLRAAPGYHDSAEPAGTHSLRFVGRGLEMRAPHRTMTILGRVMRARSAPRVPVARHELGQAPSSKEKCDRAQNVAP